MGCTGSSDSDVRMIKKDEKGEIIKATAKVVFIMGGPGTGKSTVCEMVA